MKKRNALRIPTAWLQLQEGPWRSSHPAEHGHQPSGPVSALTSTARSEPAGSRSRDVVERSDKQQF